MRISYPNYHAFSTAINIIPAHQNDTFKCIIRSIIGKGKRADMETLRRVVNNTLISLLGQAITWVSTIALTVAYGRYLSDVKFGELYFALTFVLLIGIFLEFGFNQQLVRDVAQDESKTSSYFSNALFLKAILWVLVYVFIILICLLLGYSPEQRALVEICGITLFIRSLVNVVSGLHFAAQRTAFPAIGSILEKGLSALVGIVLLVHGANVVDQRG